MSDLIKHYRQLVGIAHTWAGKNLPGWCDDTHRDLLSRHGAVELEGRISASTLNLAQLAAVLEDYESRGWPRQRTFQRTGGKPVQPPDDIRHLLRMWGKLGHAGAVDNASRHALLAFCARQVKREVPDLDSLAVKERQAIIEALKGWLNRVTH